MSTKKKGQQESDLDLVETYSKIEKYVNENNRTVTIAIAMVAFIVIGYFGYTRFYIAPHEKEASELVFMAQSYFEQDSLLYALNGDGGSPGFLEIIDEFGGTKTANLSQYYAGMCFLKLGNFEEAIKYLKKFDSDDMFIQTLAWSAIGDAYIELGDHEKGLSYFVKAANYQPNELVTPFLLLKSGLAYEALGKFEKAKEQYEKLFQDFPDTQEGKDVEKNIARVEAKM